MSHKRRNRRKTQKKHTNSKNRVTTRDKVIGIIALIVVFIIAAILAIYLAISSSS